MTKDITKFKKKIKESLNPQPQDILREIKQKLFKDGIWPLYPEDDNLDAILNDIIALCTATHTKALVEQLEASSRRTKRSDDVQLNNGSTQLRRK